MNEKYKIFLSIFLTFFITTIVVGGITFLWQKNITEARLEEEKNKVENLLTKVSGLEKQIENQKLLNAGQDKLIENPKIFFSEDDSQISVIDANGNSRKEIANGYSASLSPDGSKLFYATGKIINGEVIVTDLVENKIIFKTKIPVSSCNNEGYKIGEVSWVPNSQNVAYILQHIGSDIAPDKPCMSTDGKSKLYIVNLKNNKSIYYELTFDKEKPVYSNDGSKIILEKSGTIIDSTDVKVLTSVSLPNSQWLCKENVFVGKCNDNLCSIDINTNQQQRLTFYSKHKDIHPEAAEYVADFKVTSNCSKIFYKTARRWLPPVSPHSGKELEYYSQTLHVMDADGKNDILLATYVGEYQLTHDGKKIVYWDGDRLGTVKNGIYIINVDGENKRKITESELASGPILLGSHLLISPDDQKIVFATDDGIYTINTDGKDQKKIVNIIIQSPLNLPGPGLIDWR